MKYIGLFFVAVTLAMALQATAQPKGGITPIGGAPWQPTKDESKVVYGTDDRIDVYQESDPARLAVSKSACALVDSSDLTNNGNGTYTLDLYQYKALGLPPCSGEPFASQPTAAFCSGFMVGDDIIATAGHCLDTSSESTTRFVFGFVMTNATTPVSTFPSSQIYTPVEILGHALSGDYDYTIARVDRKITATGAHSLSIRRTGTIAIGTTVGLIGHPAGLPLKIAYGANTAVRSNSSDGYFVANTDSYGGNSGSPVVNQATGVVEGILVRGENDYVSHTTCFTSYTVANNQGRGEDISKATSFASFVPEIVGHAGTLNTNTSVTHCGGTVTLDVRDSDLTGSNMTITAVSSNFDTEVLTLPALVGQPGVYELTVTVNSGSPLPNNHIIETTSGGSVTFTYHDADNGTDSAANIAKSMTLDCTPPSVTGIQVSYVGSSQATVTFATSETATSTVHYGTACGVLGQMSTGESATMHTVTLNDLSPLTDYFFSVEVTDTAGNSATMNNGGQCFHLKTLAPLDYLTEFLTTTAATLGGHRLTYTPANTPSGYTLCSDTASAYETNPVGGTELTPLSDDAVVSLLVGSGKSVLLFGQSYNEVLLCANGFLTFDVNDSSYEESLDQHFKFKRVSAFFHDLSPNKRGSVSYRQTADRLAITFDDVPEYTASDPTSANSQNFQIEMFFDGRIQFTYLGISASSAVVGLSNGLGLASDFTPSDLLGYPSCVNDDSDGDGLPDAWEVRAGLNPNSAIGDDGASGDPDGDGLTNLQEYQLGTNPKRADSDLDGVNDGAEVAAGTDPTGATQLHSADTDGDHKINLVELLRIIQFYNFQAFHCQDGTEDGYAPGPGAQDCFRHNADFLDPPFQIGLSELLRIIQFYNSAGYGRDMLSEDTFATLSH